MSSKEKICGIYCIENLVNGKKYIGFSINIRKRKMEHIKKLNSGNHYNDHLQRAWNLYGEEKFSFYIIEECDKELLSEREIYYIDSFDTVSPNGYNLTFGGEGGLPSDEVREKLSGKNNHNYGKHPSDETRLKLSKAKSGENHPNYGKTGLLSHNYGKRHSKETKAKISNAMSGKNNHMYGKTGENNPFYGKKHSKESKAKMSESTSGENHPMYGKHHNEETIAKMSEIKAGENNPFYGKHHSEETKAKISEKAKARYAKRDDI